MAHLGEMKGKNKVNIMRIISVMKKIFKSIIIVSLMICFFEWILTPFLGKAFFSFFRGSFFMGVEFIVVAVIYLFIKYCTGIEDKKSRVLCTGSAFLLNHIFFYMVSFIWGEQIGLNLFLYLYMTDLSIIALFFIFLIKKS